MVPPPLSDVILNTANTILIVWCIILVLCKMFWIVLTIVDTSGLLDSQPSDPITFMTMRGGNCMYMIDTLTSTVHDNHCCPI